MPKAKHKYYDVVIIGAGPAGLSFAKALADTDLQIAIIDKLDQETIANPPDDGRDLALSHASEKIMRDLGIWGLIPQEQIGIAHNAKVVNGLSPYVWAIGNDKTRKGHLCCIVPNQLIRQAAYKSITGYENIHLITDVTVDRIQTTTASGMIGLSNDTELHASLIIAADSRFSDTRKKMGIPASMQDFGRTAIACRMQHELPHDGIVHGCHHLDRTFVVSPKPGNRSSVVIIVPSNEANQLLKMSAEEFADDFNKHFNSKLGKTELASERHSYPLVAVFADRFIANRFALIGDAAVGMHPITAHGFNLGLHSIKVLSNEILGAIRSQNDIASHSVLANYQAKHRRKSREIYLGTNFLVRLYSETNLPARILRGGIFKVSNNVPMIKRYVLSLMTNPE